ncbi:MAG: glycerophosphodiester phosphodiesterase family protein [Alphaproteobacteria bacterium]|nr:glycerophosphodiester phosphodiesterase family protein [Alphaproteobacteria bacterium]
MTDALEFLPPVIAHRGAPFSAPENTLESFIAAKKAGATWIEVDVKLTSDGVPVLMHDETLDRTTSGHGRIAEMSWAQVQALDAGQWFSPTFSGTRVTSLQKTLEFCALSEMRAILELKPSPGRTQATVMVTLIEAAKSWPENVPPPVISSFDRDALAIAAQLRPDWPRALLLRDWTEDWLERAVLAQSSCVAINCDLLTSERLAFIRGTPLPVLAYTINNPVRAQELLKSGIKAIYSDDAPLLLKNQDVATFHASSQKIHKPQLPP